MTNFFRRLSLLAGAGLVSFIVGCAHPISVQPDISKLEAVAGQPKSDKVVGLVINPADRSLQVTTPGGGGDKVSYFPYRDMETAIFKMLGNLYKDVTILANANDKAAIDKAGLTYVFIPKIVTNSSSPSAFTWPPTRFSVDLTCRVLDASGKEIASIRVDSEGRAEFDEFKSDFSLSAKRGALEAVQKMQAELAKSVALR